MNELENTIPGATHTFDVWLPCRTDLNLDRRMFLRMFFLITGISVVISAPVQVCTVPIILNEVTFFKMLLKDLSLCHTFSFCKTYIFATLWYQRSTTFGCNDIEFRKSEFVAKNQFLYSNNFLAWKSISHHFEIYFQKSLFNVEHVWLTKRA